MTSEELDQMIISKYNMNDELKPILDGIINEEFYSKSKPKILWILWEPYDDDSGYGGGDCRANMRENIDEYLKIRTWKRIALTSAQILKFNSEKNISLSETLNSIAFININKYPADHTSSNRWAHFKNIYDACGKVLLAQIKFINPDIVIGGNILYLFKDDLGLSKNVESHIPGRVAYEKDGTLFIDALHPSRKDEKYMADIVKTATAWIENR